MTSFTWNPPSLESLNQEVDSFYTLPEEFTNEVVAKGFTRPERSTWSARQCVYAIEGLFSLGSTEISMIGNRTFHPHTSYSYGGTVSNTGRLPQDELSLALLVKGVPVVYRDPFNRRIYMAAPYKSGPYASGATDGRVSYVVILPPASNSAHRQHDHFMNASSGVLPRILRPLARKVGIDIGADKFSYRVSASGLGHTCSQDVEVPDLYASLISSLLFNKVMPDWHSSYNALNVESFFEKLLLDTQIASPELLGLDRATWDYVGSQDDLQDSMFYGFVEYARNAPDAVKNVMLLRNDATISKAVDYAFALVPSFKHCVGEALSLAQVGLTKKAAAQRVVAALEDTIVPESDRECLAGALDITVVLGSNQATLRDMALRLYERKGTAT